jgi:hypothetical protein
MEFTAILQWTKQEVGGRAHPPCAGLRPVIRFQKHIGTFVEGCWDVEILRVDVDQTTWIGETTMQYARTDWQGDLKAQFLKEDGYIELLDGFRVIALGRVIRVDWDKGEPWSEIQPTAPVERQQPTSCKPHATNVIDPVRQRGGRPVDLFGVDDPKLERSIRKKAINRSHGHTGWWYPLTCGLVVGAGVLIAQLCDLSRAGVYVVIVFSAVACACIVGWLSRRRYQQELEGVLRSMSNRCLQCGYDLQGVEGDCCPECGTPRS